MLDLNLPRKQNLIVDQKIKKVSSIGNLFINVTINTNSKYLISQL